MRISDWSSDVCSSDLGIAGAAADIGRQRHAQRKGGGLRLRQVEEAGADEEVGGRAEYGDRTAAAEQPALVVAEVDAVAEQRARAEQAEALVDRGVALRPGKQAAHRLDLAAVLAERSEEHTSELQSLMRISYAVFCLKKKK